MADISKITLPSGNTYNIKDETARDAIAALEGGSFFLGKSTTALTDGATTNPIQIEGVTGTTTVTNGNIAVYGNAEFIWNGSKWVEFGDLSTLGGLATKDTVSLNKGSGDQVLGEATTFTASSSSVSFGTHSTQTFVKSVTADTTKKLVTTTIPNVTGNTNVSIPNVTANADKQISIAMGTGNDSETLIFSGDFTNNTYTASKTTLGTNLSASKVTLGTAITAATGSATTSGTGAAVVTDVTIGDSAAAITALGAGTAAAQTITVGTNDKVKVAKYDDLSVTVS